MKKKIILFLSLLFGANLFGQHYLHLEGRIDNRDTLAWLIKAKIELFTADSALLKTVFTNDSGKYQLEIPLDKETIYSIKVSYLKFVHKYFTVSTEGIPKVALEMAFPVIEANLALFEKIPHVDYSLLDKPLNKYYYDKLKDNYVYDKEYLDAVIIKLEGLKLAEGKTKKENVLALIRMHEEEKIKTRNNTIAIFAILIILLIGFFIYKKRQNKHTE